MANTTRIYEVQDWSTTLNIRAASPLEAAKMLYNGRQSSYGYTRIEQSESAGVWTFVFFAQEARIDQLRVTEA